MARAWMPLKWRHKTIRWETPQQLCYGPQFKTRFNADFISVHKPFLCLWGIVKIYYPPPSSLFALFVIGARSIWKLAWRMSEVGKLHLQSMPGLCEKKKKKKTLCKPRVQNHVFIDWSKSAYKQTRQQRAGAIISSHCKYFFQAETATPYKWRHGRGKLINWRKRRGKE